MAASNLREVNEIANSLALLISGRAQEEETEILDLSREIGRGLLSLNIAFRVMKELKHIYYKGGKLR